MAKVSEWVEKIRKAVYGKDVRESIAASIEAMNEDNIETKNKYDESIDTMKVATNAANAAAQEANEAREEIETKLSAGELSASVTVGATETSEPGESAAVTNSGEGKDVVLNFTIPRGAVGPQGPKGDPGSLENLDDQSIAFTEAEQDTDIVSGDPLKTLFGKILKTIKTFRTDYINIDKDVVELKEAKQNSFELSPTKSIATNDDLNDYTDFGCWLSPSATVTNTLKNCPVTGGGFSLRVMRGTGGSTYKVQEMIIWSGQRFFRAIKGGKWDAWTTDADAAISAETIQMFEDAGYPIE